MTELKPCDNFEPAGAWLDPTPEMLDTVLFDVIWRTIKTWDVNVPHAYSGYMGATGNHARAIYDAVVPLFHRPGDEALARKVLEAASELRAQSVQLAKLQADGDRLAGVAAVAKHELEASRLWFRGSSQTSTTSAIDSLTQALTEWKDRA